MTQQQHDITNDSAAPASAEGKRPYLKPAFSSESVFETMALACGKLRGQGTDMCRRSAASS